MTGASERPSRSPLETRKASDGSDKGLRDAMRSVHAAERALLSARHQGEIDRALAGIAADAALATSARGQLITAYYADRMARIAAHLSPAERAAQIRQLQGEEVAAMAALHLETARESTAARQSVLSPIRAQHRLARAGLARRQRAERMTVALADRRRTAAMRKHRHHDRNQWRVTRQLLLRSK